MKPDLTGAQLEEYVETRLKEHAEKLTGEGDEDLALAHDHHPAYFGGRFPAFGVSVMETTGPGPTSDRPERPAEFTVQVHFYHPAMPVRGARSREEDAVSHAKHLTRTLRGKLMEAVLNDPKLGPYVQSYNSRGGDRDEIGEARVDENERSILFVDRTDLAIRPYI